MLIANEQLSLYIIILSLNLHPFLTAANKVKTIVSIGLQVQFWGCGFWLYINILGNVLHTCNHTAVY